MLCSLARENLARQTTLLRSLSSQMVCQELTGLLAESPGVFQETKCASRDKLQNLQLPATLLDTTVQLLGNAN